MLLKYFIIFLSVPGIFCKEKIYQLEPVCGRPLGTEFILKSERIVAGYDVGYYRYPWYAALMRGNEVSCGGALIGARTVLSAAHCFKEFLSGSIRSTSKINQNLEDIYNIRLGMYNICSSIEKTVTNFKVEKVHIHELYQKKMPYFDISLLIVSSSTDLYLPACMPKGIINPENRPKEGTVPGMGTLKYQGPMPCTLHEARLLTYPDDTCQNMMNGTGGDGGTVENAFCAGYLQGGIDTCQGDSGGPLQFIDENGDYVILGIVSFGFHCAVPGYLGMYTDVSKYIDWIEEKSGLNFSKIHNNENIGAILNNSTKGPKKVYYEKPYKHPIRIIILKDHRFEQRLKSVEHIPIKRIH